MRRLFVDANILVKAVVVGKEYDLPKHLIGAEYLDYRLEKVTHRITAIIA